MIARRYHAQQKAVRADLAAARKLENEAWERAERLDREPVIAEPPPETRSSPASDKQRHQPRR